MVGGNIVSFGGGNYIWGSHASWPLNLNERVVMLAASDHVADR
jgi:hypothetical protein